MGLLSGATVIVVDTETTGFDAHKDDRITEVAAVRLDDGAVGETWASLTDPGRPVPPEVQRLTKITDQMVRGAPSQAGVAAELRARIGDLPVAIHNAPFDLSFLVPFFARAGAPPLLNPIVDTLGLARGLSPGGSNRLFDVAGRLGYVEKDAHRALADALATAFVLQRLAEAWERDKGVRSLAELAAVSQDVIRLTARRR